MPDETDGELALRARDGDEDAVSELVRRHLGAVLSLCVRITGDRAAAEDAAQEAFVKAWRNLKRYDEEKPFRPWMLQIARNASLDLLRKRRATPFSALSGADDAPKFEDSLEDDAPLPDEVFERARIGEEVSDALGKLPERDRSVLSLRYEDGLSFDEIAEVMKAPMNTVKSWHRRALAKMRALLVRRDT
jgi:RNA polymerase sigma-70 factor (ECF subfamily)